MEDKETSENDQQTENQKTFEDHFLTVEIIKRALEFRPYIMEGILGEKFLNLSK